VLLDGADRKNPDDFGKIKLREFARGEVPPPFGKTACSSVEVPTSRVASVGEYRQFQMASAARMASQRAQNGSSFPRRFG
jgi:hypothetical protein